MSRRAPAAAVLALAVIAGACGSTRPPAPTASGPQYEVSSATVSGLGRVLVDGAGYTLYLYLPDDHSSRSTCNDVCTAEWPPLVLPADTTPVAGAGVRAQLLGFTVRNDGERQLTYDGWPLYRWSQDMRPGQATGEGLFNAGGLWFVVSTSGTPVRS